MQNTKLTKLKRPALILGEVLLLVGITLFAVFPFSCKVSTSGIEVVGSDYTVPSLNEFSVESSTKLLLSFSDEVKLLTAAVSEFEAGITDSIAHSATEELSPALASASASDKEIPVNISYGADRKSVAVTFLDETKVGQKYIFYGEAENKIGSSLTFTVSFVGYNSKVPHLLLTEIHDGISSNNAYLGVKEFIEFISLNDGNLAGLVVKLADKGESATFAFPAIEVKKDDYITIHYQLNTNDPELCINEITGDKTLSSAKGSSLSAWDFWLDTNGVLSGANDVITLENSNTGQILQALVYSKTNAETDWGNQKMRTAAQRVTDAGVWGPTSSFEDAFTDKKIVGIKRTNVDTLISDYESGKLSYPFPSNKNEWKYIYHGGMSPGNKN